MISLSYRSSACDWHPRRIVCRTECSIEAPLPDKSYLSKQESDLILWRNLSRGCRGRSGTSGLHCPSHRLSKCCPHKSAGPRRNQKDLKLIDCRWISRPISFRKLPHRGLVFQFLRRGYLSACNVGPRKHRGTCCGSCTGPHPAWACWERADHLPTNPPQCCTSRTCQSIGI
jgi:hypothetical protein